MKRAIAILAVAVGLTLYADAHARVGRQYAVGSTAYDLCSSGPIMADGRHVHTGAVAINFLPLGTRIRLDQPIRMHNTHGVLERRRAFVVEDRIGWGTQADFWFARCAEANAYGRQRRTFRVVTR